MFIFTLFLRKLYFIFITKMFENRMKFLRNVL